MEKDSTMNMGNNPIKKIELYSYYRSTAAFRVRIALEFKNIPYTIIPIDLSKGDQSQSNFTRINPHQRVPFLVHGDTQISQSLAIIEYLEHLVPQPTLLSQDLQLCAQMRSVAMLIACDIHPLNIGLVKTFLHDELKLSHKEINHWYQHWIYQGFSSIEKILPLQDTSFCYGEHFSIADLCLVAQYYNILRFQLPIMEHFPRIHTICQHCLTLPFVQAAHPEKQPDHNPSQSAASWP